LKIFIFTWKILRGIKTHLNLPFFSIKFSNLEKLIMGILLGILKLKKNNFRNIFWREHFKTRKNLKISIFPCEILRGKTPLKLLFFSIKFSNLENLNLGILQGILKLNKIIF
jgi:hypothetical protein